MPEFGRRCGCEWEGTALPTGDGGKCRMCDASDELHFDHIVPFSRGGTSLTAENVQLLCARHNLQKRDRIE
jgi:5-methylcytosine-specific restriction endonuclease McrA